MYDKHEIMALLNAQGALTIDMCDAFVRGKPKVLYADNDSVYMIHGCHVHMFWARDESAAQKALHGFDKAADLCVVHGERAYYAYKEKFGRANDDGFCNQYCLMNKVRFDIPNGYSIRKLGYKDIPFIQEHYHLSNNTSYLRSRIRGGELWGISMSEDGSLAGFIGSHSDGSIGMLEILPEYRRRGLGTVLEHFQMNRHLEKGWTPYGQVFINNPESVALQKSVGLDVSSDIICWV